MRELRDMLADLWSDRHRLSLVVFALAWGTLGLTLLLGFASGFEDAMQAVLRRSGDRMLRLSAGSTTQPFEGLPAGRPVAVTQRDAAAVSAMQDVRRVSVEYSRRLPLRIGQEQARNVRVHGVDRGYTTIRGLTIQRGGRGLSPTDQTERRRTAVLGHRIARELFGRAEPVGRTCTIAGQRFVVVGVLARQIAIMSYDGQDDDKVFVPAQTLRTIVGLRDPSYLLVEARVPTESARLLTNVRRLLAARHGFHSSDEGAVEFRDHAAFTRQIGGLVAGIRIFLSIVGVLGLLVSAIGVANVMHALVEERIGEIGLRIALGARPGQIRRRQLLETATVVILGGGGGLLVATGLLHALDAIPLPAEVRAYLGSPTPSIAVASSVALLLAACALVAGWQPAHRAASIQPIEALRA